MGIYDAMKLCTADISTVCLGLAASTAAFLLACGTKGKRFCMPNSKVMFQQTLGTAGGTVDGLFKNLLLFSAQSPAQRPAYLDLYLKFLCLLLIPEICLA